MTDDPLRQLYPFLHAGQPSNAAVAAALTEAIAAKATDHTAVTSKFFAHNTDNIIAAARTIADTYRNNGRMFTMGNGGSSCDAAHLAVEFQHPVTAGRPALTAIDLSADRTMLTAVANDVGFAHVFVRQLIALARPGDCLIGLSTSGNSQNLVHAFKKAREIGLKTIGLAGMSGGEMARLELDHCLIVETDSIHRVQEVHVTLYHIVWDLVHALLANDRGGLNAPAKEP